MQSYDIKQFELAQLERAKRDFLNNVQALIIVQGDIERRVSYCKANKKSHLFTVDEGEVFAQHLLEIVSGLMGDYDTINTTAKHSIFRRDALEIIAEGSLKKEVLEQLEKTDKAA